MGTPRKTRRITPETAARLAEGIGETLARLVNRLESLDAERERVREQLSALRDTLNDQLAHFRQTVGRRPADRPARAAASTGERRRRSTGRAPTTQKGKRPVRCGICGTEGHNARGHAKWEAARSRR